MASRIIQDSRIRDLNDRPVRRRGGGYALYWMQQSQRAEDNHALELAAQRANELGLPLVVGFGLTGGFPEANLRHYRFMLEGVREVEASLARREIRFVVRLGDPAAVALELAADAALMVCDRGYLRHQKAWRRRVAAQAACRVVEVESDVVVPVGVVSGKREHAARTLRPRLHRHLDDYLVELATTPVDHGSLGLGLDGLDLADPDALLAGLDLDRGVPPVPLFRGGTSAAKRLLLGFLDEHMSGYDGLRNQPQTDAVSHMSKYLHFGQVSPLWVALHVEGAVDAPEGDRASYLEELLVRRELAMNFVEHAEDDYDRYDTLPGWARRTLADHAEDDREHLYTDAELVAAETHDPYWNAAMREMVHTGYMHNYMRMYWGKKILEWSASPEEAFDRALHFNNRFFLDGRDANSYAGVAWCFGLHDRPWTERPVFGKVRYMSQGGLKRKADPDAYVDKVERLIAQIRND
jgi:deoxyribodipyrimidine photo-lyase